MIYGLVALTQTVAGKVTCVTESLWKETQLLVQAGSGRMWRFVFEQVNGKTKDEEIKGTGFSFDLFTFVLTD